MDLKPTLIRVAIQSHLMSLFSNVGRKFEKTKRAFIDDEAAEYACMSCENPVDEEYEYCPHCGKETVEPVE
jgi:Zn finger protein HypA/HybF involved in hydrogenase expression